MWRNVTNGISPAYPRRGYSKGIPKFTFGRKYSPTCWHMPAPIPPIISMKPQNPYIALDLNELAPLCAHRVGRLRAKDWSTPAERDLLREDTALLLDAVAQQLGTSNGSARPADAITLSELVNSIEHGPLSRGRRTQAIHSARVAKVQKSRD